MGVLDRKTQSHGLSSPGALDKPSFLPDPRFSHAQTGDTLSCLLGQPEDSGQVCVVLGAGPAQGRHPTDACPVPVLSCPGQRGPYVGFLARRPLPSWPQQELQGRKKQRSWKATIKPSLEQVGHSSRCQPAATATAKPGVALPDLWAASH